MTVYYFFFFPVYSCWQTDQNLGSIWRQVWENYIWAQTCKCDRLLLCFPFFPASISSISLMICDMCAGYIWRGLVLGLQPSGFCLWWQNPEDLGPELGKRSDGVETTVFPAVCLSAEVRPAASLTESHESLLLGAPARSNNNELMLGITEERFCSPGVWEKDRKAELRPKIIPIVPSDFSPKSFFFPAANFCSRRKPVLSGFLCWCMSDPGQVLENAERSQQLRLLLQLQPPVQPHRVGIGECWLQPRARMESRCWSGAQNTPVALGKKKERARWMFFSFPSVWREREDMGRENREVLENVAGSFRPRLGRKSGS